MPEEVRRLKHKGNASTSAAETAPEELAVKTASSTRGHETSARAATVAATEADENDANAVAEAN